ncbi:hypothetical protein D3C77_474160 [compost metagenome]
MGTDENQQEQHRDEGVEVARVAKVDQHMAGNRQVRARDIEQTVVATGPAAQRIGQEVGHLAERQGQHDKVDTGTADGQGADQQRQGSAKYRGTEQGREHAPVQVNHQQRRAISTHAEEDALAERQQPGETQQQVTGQRCKGENQDFGGQGGRWQQQRQTDQGGNHQQQQRGRAAFGQG